MENKKNDVIIIGGSYAGLSAGMALGRSLRNTLIIDHGKPCNRQTPHSHNFVTHDGKTPKEISELAKNDVEKYPTVQFYDGTVISIKRNALGFEIETFDGEKFQARKVILASGVKDIMPDIPGFAECWGISVLHCPYCHGYEVKSEETGILADGDMAYEFSKLIFNMTKNLTLFTNGKTQLTVEQIEKLKSNNINLNEDKIEKLEHKNGQLQKIVFKNGNNVSLKVLYAKIPFEQNVNISQSLDCKLTEQGYIQVDFMQKTTTPGVFACGDNVTMMRSVANAIAQGNFTGAMVNKELSEEDF
ncbi:pyridine nucleotide-disulfide oxidoreductase [Chryseobacterium artocarpi]|uniref:Pyridine nucleotide-disulfide oxidoreductase n=1 Tax=Chryseobacterium artocarpi TaxID=1414727 RepID=A0A1B8ZFV2_9FLAO|nr:NAD(P)/FAD-dependent oxidoreductase [Chryseobacterium artocarpi]OCA70490.1 pyridine nucleotide-disulfide oxidoreductase [Chryseobacterium artocarpi]